MSWLAKATFYLRSLFAKRDLEHQLTEEVQIHVEMATEANIAAGMSPEEASYAALREFGNVAGVQERTRDERGWVWLEQWGKDIHFTVRSLSRARGFTLTVLATLVLGIGVATIAYDLTAWMLFRTQPYPHPERLFVLGFSDKQNGFIGGCVSVRLQAFQQQTAVFSEYAAAAQETMNVVNNGEPGIATVTGISVDCLRTLGIKPVLGRGFLPGEHRKGANNVVLLSDIYWREKFQAANDVLGHKILVDQQICTVVGVLAADQSFPAGFSGDLYRPQFIELDPANPLAGSMVIGRLAEGMSPEQAVATLAAVKVVGLPAWAEAYLADEKTTLRPLTHQEHPEAPWVVFIAAVFLYAIACLNTMNLLLVRLLGRRRELSIRLSVGGSRARIVRLIVLEAAGLALTASLLVALAARWVFPSLLALLTDNVGERYRDFWDWPTLGCIIGLGLLACLAGVLVPAWRLVKTDLTAALKEGGAALGESRGMARLRNALVALQAAFAIILLAGAGLMIRSFEKLHKVDLGFNPAGVVQVRIAFPRDYDLPPAVRLQLFDRLRDKLAFIPGVRGVTYGQSSLLVGGFWGTAQLLMPDGTDQQVVGSFVANDFQRVVGITLKQGRWLSGEPGKMEAVINETMAHALFGDRNPIGLAFKIRVSGDYPYEIVGVTRDVKYDVHSGAGMSYYVPLWMYPPNAQTLVLRLDENPPPEFAGIVRQVIHKCDPRLIASEVASIDESIGNSIPSERFALRILKILSGIALGLAMVGLFSVIAFAVESRMREFGVRLALGATPGDLRQLVLRRSLTTAAFGVTAGVGAALGLTRFMQSLLFETTPNDPVVYLAVAALLLVAAALACWLPAWRAAKVDPVVALRSE